MISLPRFRLIAGLCLTAACDSSRPADAGRASGRFELRRLEPDAATLVRVPATATWCDVDSSLVIVGMTGSGVGGIAARATWPMAEPGAFTVSRALGSVGTATVAWRELGDSVSAAFVADSGRVELHGNGVVSGVVLAAGVDKDTARVRVRGTVENVPVVRACPGANP